MAPPMLRTWNEIAYSLPTATALRKVNHAGQGPQAIKACSVSSVSASCRGLPCRRRSVRGKRTVMSPSVPRAGVQPLEAELEHRREPHAAHGAEDRSFKGPFFLRPWGRQAKPVSRDFDWGQTRSTVVRRAPVNPATPADRKACLRVCPIDPADSPDSESPGAQPVNESWAVGRLNGDGLGALRRRAASCARALKPAAAVEPADPDG